MRFRSHLVPKVCSQHPYYPWFIPNTRFIGSLEATAKSVRAAWASQVDRITIDGASDEEKDVFFTGVVHTLQVSIDSHMAVRSLR
jgi:hypothetical protein